MLQTKRERASRNAADRAAAKAVWNDAIAKDRWCVWSVYDSKGVPRKRQPSKSLTRLLFQADLERASDIVAAMPLLIMHEGEPIPAVEPGDPVNDIRVGILRFVDARPAPVSVLQGPPPRSSLRRAAVAAVVPAIAEEPLSSEEQSVLTAAQQWFESIPI